MVNHLKLLSIKFLFRNIRGQRTTSLTRSLPIWKSPISRPSFDLTATELGFVGHSGRSWPLKVCSSSPIVVLHLWYIYITLRPADQRVLLLFCSNLCGSGYSPHYVVTTCRRISNFKGGNHCTACLLNSYKLPLIEAEYCSTVTCMSVRRKCDISTFPNMIMMVSTM